NLGFPFTYQRKPKTSLSRRNLVPREHSPPNRRPANSANRDFSPRRSPPPPSRYSAGRRSSPPPEKADRHKRSFPSETRSNLFEDLQAPRSPTVDGFHPSPRSRFEASPEPRPKHKFSESSKPSRMKYDSQTVSPIVQSRRPSRDSARHSPEQRSSRHSPTAF